MGRVWQPSSQEVSIVAGLKPVYEFPSASVTRGWESRHGAAVEAGPWPERRGAGRRGPWELPVLFVGRSDRGGGQGPASRKVDRGVPHISSVH